MPAFHGLTLLVCILIFLATLLFWPLGSLGTRGRRKPRLASAIQREAGSRTLADTRAIGVPQEESTAGGAREHAQPGGSTGLTSAETPRSWRARWARLAPSLARIVCALNALVVVGPVVAAADSGDAMYGPPPALVVAVTLGLCAAAVTPVVVACAVLAWAQRLWGPLQRIGYTLLAIAAVAFVCELAFWNLLGYHF